MIIEELETQLDEINNAKNNPKLKNIINIKNNGIDDNKYKDLFIRPNITGLMNHLKKDNEKLRKLLISYELKNKKNIYKLNNNKENDFKITKFNIKIIKKSTKENKNMNKNISRDYNYKYNYSNKSIEISKKFKNIARMKKPEIKRIKDINLFDNDLSYMKEKEGLYQKQNNTQIYNNNTLKERNSSVSQRNRHLLNMNNNNTINSSTMRVKNVIINKNINNYILKPIPNHLSTNRSHSKVIKKRKVYDNSFNNNTLMKTMENRKNINSSLDKNILFINSDSKQKNNQYIKKFKKKENDKEIFYQKPIINKITIYNNINNNGINNNISHHLKQRMLLNEKSGKKQINNRYDINNNS